MTLLVAACVLIWGCKEDVPSVRAQASTGAASNQAWLLASEPSAALSVVDAKLTAKEGDTIVVRGRIGGRKDPMSAASPVLTIMDTSVPHCAENPEDKCATPWDYCCVPKEQITAHSATVQIVGPEGSSAVDPRAAGLKELDEIVIEGIVGPRPSDQVLTINATGVYRMQ